MESWISISAALIAVAVAVLFIGGIGSWFCFRNNDWRSRIAGALWLPATGCAGAWIAKYLVHPHLAAFNDAQLATVYKTLHALIAVLVTWGLLRIVDEIDRHLTGLAGQRGRFPDNVNSGLPGRVLKTAIIILLFLYVAQSIFGMNITALLASAGVVGLAAALAAKDTVSNFFGSVILFTDVPFRVGDRIECDQVKGIVRGIGIRSSRIVTEDESVCTVPNRLLADAAVIQHNRRGYLKRVIDLTLTYDTTPEQLETALNILHGIMDNFHGPDHREFSPRIFFRELGSYSLNLRAIIFFKTESFIEEEKLLNELNFAILRQFNAAGLKFAYPTRSVVLTETGRETRP